MENKDVVLELKDITKIYPGVKALGNVSLQFRRNELHAIAGENGAGKSTLIKIITGCITPSSGKIIYDSKEYDNFTPDQALKLGIGAVYQEFNLVPYLKVYENIFLGREIKKGLFLDKEAMISETNKILSDLGININPDEVVCNLTVAYQQIIEIAKSVSRDIKFLILDEPSAPLTEPEVIAMFKVIKKLKDKGVTLVYISHRLEEIFQIADRVSVFRDGQFIKTMDVSQTNKQQLISAMVGREILDIYPKRNTEIGDVILEVKNLKAKMVNGVSFSLKKSEILGLGGLVGAGRTEVARAIFGANEKLEGDIILNGKKITINSPIDAIKNGIGLIPEDRKHEGLLLNNATSFNITYANLKKISIKKFINFGKEKVFVKEQINNLRIKVSSDKHIVKNLSGGNQQKCVLSKWLFTDCSVLIFDEPTRGVDVSAKQEIYKLMRELSDEGYSIIMISSDMPELLGMSDRIIVMQGGKISGEVKGDEVTQERVLELAAMGSVSH